MTTTKRRVTDYWKTHPDWHQPVIAVLGSDDLLDPCADAERAFPATWYLTEEDDGLSRPWPGRFVFMNPPFSQSAPWLNRLAKELQSGWVLSAIALTLAGVLNNRTTAAAIDMASAFCLPRGRVSFRPGHPELEEASGSFDRDVVFSFYGAKPHLSRFLQEFGPYGRLLLPRIHQLPIK